MEPTVLVAIAIGAISILVMLFTWWYSPKDIRKWFRNIRNNPPAIFKLRKLKPSVKTMVAAGLITMASLGTVFILTVYLRMNGIKGAYEEMARRKMAQEAEVAAIEQAKLPSSSALRSAVADDSVNKGRQALRTDIQMQKHQLGNLITMMEKEISVIDGGNRLQNHPPHLSDSTWVSLKAMYPSMIDTFTPGERQNIDDFYAGLRSINASLDQRIALFTNPLIGNRNEAIKAIDSDMLDLAKRLRAVIPE